MNIMIYIRTVQHGLSNSVEATIFSFASRYVVCSKITISSRNAQNISQVSHQHRDNPEPPPRLGQGARYPENIWTHLQFVLKSLKETHISKVNSSEISIKNYNKSITKLEEKVKVLQEETSTLPSTITLLKSDATSHTLLAGVSESEKIVLCAANDDMEDLYLVHKMQTQFRHRYFRTPQHPPFKHKIFLG